MTLLFNTLIGSIVVLQQTCLEMYLYCRQLWLNETHCMWNNCFKISFIVNVSHKGLVLILITIQFKDELALLRFYSTVLFLLSVTKNCNEPNTIPNCQLNCMHCFLYKTTMWYFIVSNTFVKCYASHIITCFPM